MGKRTTAQRLIAFFGHDSTESTIIKRVTAFEANGARVIGFMFRRRRGGERPPTWENVDLGLTVERNYAVRVPKLFAAIRKVLKHRPLLRQCGVFYARNIDMLFVAAMAKALTGSKAALVYEVLDVQRAFVGRRLVNRLFRWMERVLLRRCALLVVSSPDFMSHYFVAVQRYRGPWRLLENKVAATQIPADASVALRRPPPAPPWTIGWFGILRCTRSLEALCRIADALGERVSVQIRGILSEDDLTAEALAAAQRGRPNLTFGGPYRSPQDLPDMYGAVHLVWCIDYLDAGANSDWLLPNRLYEGGLMGAVAIARAGTATGRFIERERLGWTLAEPLDASVIDLLGRLSPADYAEMRSHVERRERSLFVDETDTRALVDHLCQLSGRSCVRTP